jgi:hypothetical protein
VQGFSVDTAPDSEGAATLANAEGHSALGKRSLAIRYQKLSAGRAARVSTPTFTPPDALTMPGYRLHASPTLYSGQTVQTRLQADEANQEAVTAQLYIRVYGENDLLKRVDGTQVTLNPGESCEPSWQIPDTQGDPIEEIGIEVRGRDGESGTVYLDSLTWSGTPTLTLTRPAHDAKLWRSAWVDGVDYYGERWPESFRLVQNNGRGLLIQGARDWTDYAAAATIASESARAVGIAVRVQGMKRYYALLLCAGNKIRLVKALDGDTILAEADFAWESTQSYALRLAVEGNHLRGWIDGQMIVEASDAGSPLSGGGAAYVIEEGTLMSDAMAIEPV